MELTEFVFRLIILFLPGLIAFEVIRSLIYSRKMELHEVVIRSLMLGFLCQLIWYWMSLLNFLNIQTSFLTCLMDTSKKVDIKEVFYVSVLSIPIALVVTAIINYRLLWKLGRALAVSKKTDDTNLLNYLMNEDIEPWVTIRDTENDLMYDGWIMVYPDNDEQKTLFLKDAIVYKNSTGKRLYKTPGIMLTQSDSMIIDFRDLNSPKKMGWKKWLMIKAAEFKKFLTVPR